MRSGQTGRRASRFDDDLIGLDPDDPEARAFAAHLDKMERGGPRYTIEASLADVAEFADSTNRSGGLTRLVAVAVICLILLGVLVTAWTTLGALLAALGG